MLISSSATVDSQTRVWTDSVFPGDYDSSKDAASLTTFYIDENGQPQKTYVVSSYTENSSAYGDLENCFLKSGTNNVNDVKYIYLYGTTAGTRPISSTLYSELGSQSVTFEEWNNSGTTGQTLAYESASSYYYYYTLPINPDSIISNLSFGSKQASKWGTSIITVEAAPNFDFGDIKVEHSYSICPTYSDLYDYPAGTGLLRMKVNTTGFVVHYDYHVVWLYNSADDNVDPSNIKVSTIFETMVQSTNITYPHFDFWLGIRANTAGPGTSRLTNFKVVVTFYIIGATA